MLERWPVVRSACPLPKDLSSVLSSCSRQLTTAWKASSQGPEALVCPHVYARTHTNKILYKEKALTEELYLYIFTVIENTT